MRKKIMNHYRQGTLLKALAKRLSWLLRADNSKLQIGYRNITNKIRYGFSAPRYTETIWVYGNKIDRMIFWSLLVNKYHSIKNTSALVINSDWPFSEAINISEFLQSEYVKQYWWTKEFVPKYAGITRIVICIEHWVKGITWEDAGAYDFMEKHIEYLGRPIDNCANRKDIIERYKNLDIIFEQAKKERALRLPGESDFHLKRKDGQNKGFVHIDSNSELIWTGPGQHRFAIAYILKIPFPVHIGLVHLNSLPYLNNFR